MRRLPSVSLVASPVLVGAVTTLIAVIAVFLAYNANQGLPFVPTRSLLVEVSSGANVVVGNDVRSGGYRIGFVSEMNPVRLKNGKVGALMLLKLDQKFGKVPDDSRIKIRARSALGLKYVELTRGRSARTLANGGTLPVSQSEVPVELDEFFNIFDEPTRRNSQRALRGFGDALAGRGADLNRFVLSSPELFGRLYSVTRNLNNPRTQLTNFAPALERTMGALAPVSDTAGRVFTPMADTLGALGRDPQALKDTIAKSPSTFDVTTRSLRVQRPFLTDLAALSADLRGGTAELRRALPSLNHALGTGIPVLRRSTALSDRLAVALGALRDLAAAPTTLGAVTGLTATVKTLQPQLRYLGPFVTVCNYWNTFWTLVAEHFSAPDATGGTERIMGNDGAVQDDSITVIGANEFAHGQNVVPAVRGGRPQYLHGNTYGVTAIAPDGTANCVAGQGGYVQSANQFAPDRATYGRAVVDSPIALGGRYPSLRVGPTFAHFDKQGKGVGGLNPARVPAGETFTSVPGGLGVTP